MKKISLLLLLMVLATNVYSQKTNEERASKITNEISEVYKIQLKRFHEVNTIRSTYAQDPETKKAELKKVYNRLFGKLKSTLGEDKMQEWKIYKRNK